VMIANPTIVSPAIAKKIRKRSDKTPEGFSPNVRTAGWNPVVLQKASNKFRAILRPSRLLSL